MGYYTYFSLTYHGSLEDEEALENYEPDDSEYNLGSERLRQLLDSEPDDCWKWYDWEDDMKKLASKFPNILFILDGDGEESGDQWEFRIKGNISEYHEVVMPPFTNSELLYNNR